MWCAKEFSSSEEIVSFNMFKRPSPSSGPTVEPQGIKSDQFSMIMTPLDAFPSAQHANRKDYLTVNVLDIYYQNDSLFRLAYFQDGKNQNEHYISIQMFSVTNTFDMTKTIKSYFFRTEKRNLSNRTLSRVRLCQESQFRVT